jgi:dihydrofolate synthase/folylpolyglutamate synthase
LTTDLAGRKITLVTGILDDKPYAAMLQSLIPTCEQVILTRPQIDRALAPQTLFAVAKALIPPNNIKIIPEVAQAVQHAVKTTGSGDVICVAGSLYVVGEAKEELERNPSLCGNRLG